MNMWGFTRAFWPRPGPALPPSWTTALVKNPLKGEYFLPSVVSQLIDEGKAQVKVLHSRDKWYGVTYKEDKPVVVAAIAEKTAQGLYPDNLWEVYSMANPAENALSEVLAAYAFAGEVVGAARFGQGHINDTFCVYTQTAEGDCVRYILQRMSAAAFKHPDQPHAKHRGRDGLSARSSLRKNGGDAARETMTVLRTKNGAALFHRDSEGGCMARVSLCGKYRCACRKQKRRSCSISFRQVAFGNFQRHAERIIPPIPCIETIEKFHDTRKPPRQFRKGAGCGQACGRVEGLRSRRSRFVKAHAAKDCSRGCWRLLRAGQAAPARDAQRHQAQQHPARRRAPAQAHLRHRPGHGDARPVRQRFRRFHPLRREPPPPRTSATCPR